MDEHRLKCEAEGRFVEAEMAKNRLGELREQEFHRQQEELIFMHTQTLQQCEKEHLDHFK